VGLRATEIGFRAWRAVPLVYGVVVVGCRIVFARLPDRLPALRHGAGALAACTTGLVAARPTSGLTQPQALRKCATIEN
jgi:hypothetical protein